MTSTSMKMNLDPCTAHTPIDHRVPSNTSAAKNTSLWPACFQERSAAVGRKGPISLGLMAHHLQSSMPGRGTSRSSLTAVAGAGDAAAAAAANGTTTLVYIQQAGNAQLAASPSDPLAGTMFMNNALDTTLYDQDYPVRKIGKTSTSNFVNAGVPTNATQWFAPAPQARSSPCYHIFPVCLLALHCSPALLLCPQRATVAPATRPIFGEWQHLAAHKTGKQHPSMCRHVRAGHPAGLQHQLQRVHAADAIGASLQLHHQHARLQLPNHRPLQGGQRRQQQLRGQLLHQRQRLWRAARDERGIAAHAVHALALLHGPLQHHECRSAHRQLHHCQAERLRRRSPGRLEVGCLLRLIRPHHTRACSGRVPDQAVELCF